MNEEYGNKYFAAGLTAADGNPQVPVHIQPLLREDK